MERKECASTEKTEPFGTSFITEGGIFADWLPSHIAKYVPEPAGSGTAWWQLVGVLTLQSSSAVE
jgi:hypothetical protein